MDSFLLLICLLLIGVAGFLSGSEIALFSLSKFQLKHIREQFRTIYKTIRQLLADPSGLLMTILICNELVNIVLSTLITGAVSTIEEGPLWEVREWMAQHIPYWAAEVVLGLMITTPLIVILGEVTPKVISARMNTIVAPIVARPMNFIYQMMAPLRWLFELLVSGFTLLVPRTRASTARLYSSARLKQEDFLSMVEEAHKEGDVQQSELDLIRSVFDMDETPVSEITTPMSEVFALPSNLTIEKALVAIRDDGHRQKFSRIPVYEGERTNVEGFLYSKDLLVAKLEKVNPQTLISTLLWKPFTVGQATRLNTVFRKMKKQRTHMAAVTNDRGEAVGIVTMNDVLDALLDELLGDEDRDFGKAH